jgi:hypothetical protein
VKLVSTILKWGAVIIGLALVGVLLGWLGSRGSAAKLAASGDGPAPLDFQPADGGPGLVEHRPKLPLLPQTNLATPTVGMGVSDLITNWEDRVEEVLSSDVSEAEKAKKLFAMFPRLPEDGQVEVAQHLSNLVANPDYAPLGQMLTNSSMPEAVLDVLMSDVLNRPNSVKLPLLLSVARNDSHAKASEAKDLLELYLEQDYANNWTQWQAQMEQWLKANPD